MPEILTTLAVAAAVMAFLLPALRHLSLLTIRSSNLMLARERGRVVLSILEARVLHASFGISLKPTEDVLPRSFGGNSPLSPPPGRWSRGPVQVWQGYPTLTGPVSENNGICRGRALVVLYAVPSALRAVPPENRALALFEGEPATLSLAPAQNLDGTDDRLNVGMERDLWSWVAFPCMEIPVHVMAGSGEKITICIAENSGLHATLMPYDEMHYLRGERFQIQHETLYSESLRTSWTNLQPRVDGILEMWFEWNPSGRLLDVRVLSAGGPAAWGRSVRPEGWPPEAPWRRGFERYDVAVVRASWLVRNL